MNFTIKPPEGCKVEDIKIESKMTNDTVETKLTYPNGFTVTSVINENGQVVTPSGDLIDLGNGVFPNSELKVTFPFFETTNELLS